MVKKGIDATLVTYNTLINGLGKNGRLEEAEDLFLRITSMGYNPDVITYNSLMSGYAMSGNTAKCLEWYSNMKKRDIKPSIGTFHPLIYSCRKEGIVAMEKMFQEMLGMDLIPDRAVYNEMIYGYAEDGNVLKATSMHQQMVDQGVDSDKVTYNCLILAHLRDRRVSEIKHIFDDMKAKGLVPKTDTYKILVKGHCDLKDFNGAYFWYREMFDAGFILNDRICYQLISGLREEGMLHEAQIVSSELSSRVQQLEG
jgi:pentatricopeptide repeat protein